MYRGKTVERRDTLVAHQQSAKHVLCLSKLQNKKVVGKLDKAFSKVEATEVERYKKLFNTAYAVAKRNRPFSDYDFVCQVQKKNGVILGNDHICRNACSTFVKSISGVLLQDAQSSLKSARFFSVMSDSSTDSAVIDQEAILLRYVSESCEPVTSVASIEHLENSRADGVFQAITKGVLKCGVNIEELSETDPKLVRVNLDGVAVNLGAKNGVAKKMSHTVENDIIVTHCVAHKLELGVLYAVKEIGYLKKFEDTVKRICKFYSFSPKRRRELKTLAAVLEDEIVMHSDIKAIRWVSSKARSLKAVCTDLHVTVMHLEQVVSSSNRADETGQAKCMLSDLKQVKFIKYLYLMMDVLGALTAASTLFQRKDLLIFEVKQIVDTLFTKLHSMTVEPGEELSKFYSLFDRNTNMFDGKLKLTGSLPLFVEDTDIHSFLEKISQYILKRFSDLEQPPLALFTVFDFRTWPFSLQDFSTYGNKEIKTLGKQFSDLLTKDEVTNLSSEWQTLKVQLSKQRQFPPLTVYVDILKRDEEGLKHTSVLVKLMLTISPSTASCERLFSNMNIVKNSLRTRLTQEDLQNQLRIIVDGKSFQEYDSLPAVEHWLKSGNRHITHKPKKPSATQSASVASTSRSVASTLQPVASTSQSVASTSAHDDTASIQPMLNDLVQSLGGEAVAREKLKSFADNPSQQCLLM